MNHLLTAAATAGMTQHAEKPMICFISWSLKLVLNIVQEKQKI